MLINPPQYDAPQWTDPKLAQRQHRNYRHGLKCSRIGAFLLDWRSALFFRSAKTLLVAQKRHLMAQGNVLLGDSDHARRAARSTGRGGCVAIDSPASAVGRLRCSPLFIVRGMCIKYCVYIPINFGPVRLPGLRGPLYAAARRRYRRQAADALQQLPR